MDWDMDWEKQPSPEDVLYELRPHITLEPDGFVRYDVGPNSARSKSLSEAINMLMIQAIKRYGAWGRNWDKEHD